MKVCMAIFIKTCEIFFFSFKTFLTNRGKYQDEDKWIWENEFDFWILHYDPFFKTFFFYTTDLHNTKIKYTKQTYNRDPLSDICWSDMGNGKSNNNKKKIKNSRKIRSSIYMYI